MVERQQGIEPDRADSGLVSAVFAYRVGLLSGVHHKTVFLLNIEELLSYNPHDRKSQRSMNIIENSAWPGPSEALAEQPEAEVIGHNYLIHH